MDPVSKPGTPVGNPAENKPCMTQELVSCEPCRLRRSRWSFLDILCLTMFSMRGFLLLGDLKAERFAVEGCCANRELAVLKRVGKLKEKLDSQVKVW